MQYFNDFLPKIEYKAPTKTKFLAYEVFMQEDVESNEEINQKRQSTLAMLGKLKESLKYLPPMSPLEEQKKFNKSKKKLQNTKQENKV